MHAQGCEQLRVMGRNDRGHGTARRQTGDIDPGFVDRVAGDDQPGQSCQHGRLAGTAALVGRVKPVPAAHLVGLGRLLRVEHHERGCRGQLIHARTACEVGCILFAAVQHHQQRQARVQRIHGRSLRGHIQIKSVALAIKVEHLPGEGRAARFGRRLFQRWQQFRRCCLVRIEGQNRLGARCSRWRRWLS